MVLSRRLRVVAVVAVAAVVPVAAAVAGPGLSTSGKAGAPAGKGGAPGQVCKHLKVKGKKTDEQRAAFKECIHDAVAKRQG